MTDKEDLERQMSRAQRLALAIGGIALIPCFLGAWGNPGQFLQSWLLAFLFWIGIALGCTAVVMLHHLVGGGWGLLVRRMLESASRTMPLMLVLIVPILLGLPRLYIWARPEAVAADALLQHKAAFLNVPFFLGRTAFYFSIWLLLAFWLNRLSSEQDRNGTGAISRRLQAVSGPGLILYGLTVTFAAVDWVMSLEPHWFSTLYGLLFIVGQVLTSFSFVIAVLALLHHRRPLAEVASKARFQDLGNLMLAFVMLWAYLSFSQFLIIWSGNLPEEVIWYIPRLRGAWAGLAVLLIAFHFALPFLLLLSRDIKRKPGTLAKVAVALLFLRLADLFWVLTPAFGNSGLRVHWMDVLAPIGMGGLWVAFFVWQLKGRPLVPVNDPQLLEERLHG